MFDVGFWEMAVIAVIALVVVGPERLPKLARTVGLWVGRAKRMVSDVKADIDREVRNADIQALDDIKKTMDSASEEANNMLSDAKPEEVNIAKSIQDSAKEIEKSAKPADG
ncbi:MAG: sec-independent protein translocase protein TatB [Parasphingorhabdus sp.]|jgi:sec-independent protein translocase protein TatB